MLNDNEIEKMTYKTTQLKLCVNVITSFKRLLFVGTEDGTVDCYDVHNAGQNLPSNQLESVAEWRLQPSCAAVSVGLKTHAHLHLHSSVL